MTIKVTPEYLAELRRLADAATPGPWDSDYRLGDIAIPVYVGEDEWEAYRLGAFECTNDAKFATASRTAIPELLDHIEKLEAANRWIPVTERLPERDCRVLIVVG